MSRMTRFTRPRGIALESVRATRAHTGDPHRTNIWIFAEFRHYEGVLRVSFMVSINPVA